MEDLTGKQLGPYQIITPLGEGGMATVYKAYQPGVERYVALKILPRHFASDPEFVGRFEQEARVLANLQHPHILPVFDSGEADGYTYIVMPFLKSGDLTDLIHGGPLPLEQIRRIISQVADALDYAHQRGLVHRDVKPSNVLLDERGNCLLSDFGITKIVEGTANFTATGGIIGTPAYMSPEQGQGRKLDGRSDIYALGIMLYEMATGRVPYQAETPMAVMIRHMNDPLPPPRQLNPALPDAVERIILKALAKQPEDRYSTAGEMMRALRAAIPETISEPADKDATVMSSEDLAKVLDSKKPLSSNLTWILASIGASILLIGVIAFFVGGGRRNEDPEVGKATAIATAEQIRTVTTDEPTEVATKVSSPTDTPTKSAATFTLSATPIPPSLTPTIVPPTATLTSTFTPSPTYTAVPPIDTPTSTPPIISGRMLYVSDCDGDFEIYLKYLGIDRPDAKLTDNNGVDDWFPDWAADGSRIVFTSNRNGNYDLFTMNADGSNQKVYVATAAWDEYGNWEPGSNRIIFSTTTETDGMLNAEIFRRNSDGSLTRLTINQGEDRNPDWHPSGDIFFASNAGGNWDIYNLPVGTEPGTSQPRNLTNHPAIDEHPVLSPNYNRLVFVRKETDTNGNGQVDDGDRGNIYMMNIDGSGVRAVTTDNLDDSPAWSPDGTWVVYSRSLAPGNRNRNLYTTHVSDSTTIQITSDNTCTNWGAAWIE